MITKQNWVGWNLQPIQVHWFMALGAGFSVTTPRFKLRYEDADWRRCLSLVVHFMGLNLSITIPLWIDNPESE